MITSNHISEFLKMKLESKSRNIHTQRTRSGFISKHAVTMQKSISIRGSNISKRHICALLQLVQLVLLYHCACPRELFNIQSTHQSQRPRQSTIFFRAPLFRSRLEARSNKKGNTNPVSTKCRLQTGYKMQTADWVQNAD